MQIAPGQDGGPGMYVPNFVNQTLELAVTDGPAPAPLLEAAAAPPPPATGDDPFSLGLTLYSASAEFRAGWYDFDGLLDRVADLGIGPGIEIVASQVLPTYPHVSDGFARAWQTAFDKHGFTASARLTSRDIIEGFTGVGWRIANVAADAAGITWNDTVVGDMLRMVEEKSATNPSNGESSSA